MPRTEQRDGSRQRARSGQDTDEQIWAAETEGCAERRKGADADRGHAWRSICGRASEIASGRYVRSTGWAALSALTRIASSFLHLLMIGDIQSKGFAVGAAG